jgi:cytochrome c biogenesis protein CcmG, thiol:disulfide interchange protein DsbE
MRWVAVVAAAALVGLLAYGLASQREDTSIDEAVTEGRRVDAPVLTLPKLGQAGQGSLADYRGEIVVLNFWASWCKPCVDELPLLERTHRKIARQDAMVLGVNYQDVTDDALTFARRYRLTYPSLRDADGRYAEEYGSRYMPETFIIDREGRVADRRRGPVDQEWLDEHLTPLL